MNFLPPFAHETRRQGPAPVEPVEGGDELAPREIARRAEYDERARLDDALPDEPGAQRIVTTAHDALPCTGRRSCTPSGADRQGVRPARDLKGATDGGE